MIAVIFEVEPHSEHTSTYFEIATELKPVLEHVDGFISVERFESLMQPGKYLSLSFWRDEEAVQRWRNIDKHRRAQSSGRNGIFSNYRLRVAHVLRDYGLDERDEAPTDSLNAHGNEH